MEISPDTVIWVHGIPYNPLLTSDLHLGDLLFDTGDGTYGVCDSIIEDRVAMRDGFVVEIAIPIIQVRKLIPTLHPNHKN